ncbi:MAG: glycogen-binding domain-containing protein [Kiritimatiellia bacterium]
MRIKSKAAVKTVTTKKAPCAKKGTVAAKPAKPAEKSVTFTLRAEAGKTVYLAGCFNKWNPEGKKMLDKKNEGLYTTTIKLPAGRHEYKFVVDGTWCADPENLDYVQNEHGTLNSVIVVK